MDIFIMYVSFYGIIAIILVLAVFLFYKSQTIKKKHKGLSFFMFCLGSNVSVVPIAFFIGGMATDSPDSNYFDFIKGFLFIQSIPFIMLIISTFILLKNKKRISS